MDGGCQLPSKLIVADQAENDIFRFPVVGTLRIFALIPPGNVLMHLKFDLKFFFSVECGNFI